MLTRLEVHGFKNLADLSVDFGPFTCIAGANGVGKSNVFDAIQFLALLADRPLMEVAEGVRTTRDERAGDPRDLFWSGDPGRTMRFAAEMLVPPEVEDDFGQVVTPSISFLRYELEIGSAAPSPVDGRGRLVLLAERMAHINIGDAAGHLRFPHSAKEFRRDVVRGRRSGGAFISTIDDGSDRVITVHQDGGSPAAGGGHGDDLLGHAGVSALRMRSGFPVSRPGWEYESRRWRFIRPIAAAPRTGSPGDWHRTSSPARGSRADQRLGCSS